MDALLLGKHIAQVYNKSYMSGTQGNTAVVLSVIDLAKSEKFRDLNHFCNIARQNIYDIDKYEVARDGAPQIFIRRLHRLRALLSLLIKSSIKSEPELPHRDFSKPSSARKRAAMSPKQLPTAKNSRIPEVFDIFPDPPGLQNLQARYREHAIAQDTEWFNFQCVKLPIPICPISSSKTWYLKTRTKTAAIAAGEEVKVFVSLRNSVKAFDQASISCVNDSKLLDSDKYSAELTKLPGPGKTELIHAFTLTVNEDAPVHSEISLKLSLVGDKLPVSTIKSTFYIKEPSSTGHALLVLTDNLTGQSGSGSR